MEEVTSELSVKEWRRHSWGWGRAKGLVSVQCRPQGGDGERQEESVAMGDSNVMNK